MLIKSLPQSERPIEKAIAQGVSSLSNAELIALILHTGSRGVSALGLAEELLANLDEGIYELASMGYDRLMTINGIGNSKACTILAAVELGKRIASSRAPKRISITSGNDVAGMFMEKLRHEKKEHFKSVLLNTKGDVISCDDISVGELSATVVHPREVFSKAISKSAAGVVFVHNHPSGDPKPSREDIRTTERLVTAGEILGIRVLDHIIIGDGIFNSLKAMGFIK